jgi:hypothetical protein
MKTLAELQAVYRLPLPDLIHRASEELRSHRAPEDI